MSKIWRPFGFACLLAASLLMTTSALRADTGPSVRVTSAVGQGVVRLDAKANGPFEYTMHHPSPDLYIINLTGVAASATDASQVLGTSLVRSYRLEQYENGNKTASQLEILVGDGATPRVERQGPQEIVIVVSKKDLLTAKSLSSAGPRIVNTALHSGLPIAITSRTPAIQEISVAKNGDTPEVLVLGSGLLKPHALRLTKPDRLVLDFAAARITAPKRTSSSIEPIRDVRVGQFSPQVARVVVDLSETGSYTLKNVDGGIAVEFQAAPASLETQASQSANPPASASASLADPKSNVSASDSTTPSRAIPAVPPASADSGAPVVSDSASKAAPSASLTSSDVQESSTTQSSSSGSVAQPAMTPASQATLPPASAPSAQQPVLEQPLVPAPIAPASASPSAAVPVPAPVGAPSSAVPVAVITQQSAAGMASAKYTGAPTSLNFKDLDVLDFFRLIHELSGLNVVVDPDVKGRLTIVLDNVPWDQALDIVLKNFDLDKQMDGNVIRIATKATMKREADEAKDLAKAQIEAADLVTTTRVLSYAKASDLVDTIKKFLSSRGDVLPDTRTNTLIISDVPSVIPVVDNLIRELDIRSQQVEIEARVVAANRSFSREIGSQFAFAGSATGGRSVFGGNPNVGGSPLTHNPPLPVPPLLMNGSTGNSMPLASNLGATVATSGVSYAFSSTNFALDYLISAAEAKGVGKLLSKPKLVAQNNLQSKVEQGTKIPVQTVVNNTISVQFVDAVLQLQVTPQITHDGTIFMNIHVENTQIDPAIPRVNGIPALDTQSEDTQVTVNDGATIMVGGIIISSQRTDIAEVPYVGSLPIIGRLFRHSTVSTTSQELLFFITPRILPM